MTEEEELWENKELGSHSPQVLINSLVYFNTKLFHLTVRFTSLRVIWFSINVHLFRLISIFSSPSLMSSTSNEQYRNTENPLRCPVNLYNFYLSKCPESVKKQNMFYLQPEESCAWDSPVWYSAERVSRATLEEILSRLHRNERTPSSPSSNRDLDETISSDE